MMAACSDARALDADLIPLAFGAQVGKPKGKGPALRGTYRIDPAAVLEKQASAVRVFPDVVSITPRAYYGFDQLRGWPPQIGCNGGKFMIVDPYDARVPRAASTAASACETDAGIKKIGALV